MKNSCYTAVRSTGLHGISLIAGPYCKCRTYFANTANVMPNITLPDFPSNLKTCGSRQFDTETAPQVMLMINNCVLTYYSQWKYCDILANKHVHAASGSRCVLMWRKTAQYSIVMWYDTIYDIIYLLTEIGLSPGSSSTVHIYTQTIHRTAQWNTTPRIERA
jgi:hypothetical protein